MDLAPGADNSELYRWLLVGKDNIEITQLSFLSMDAGTYSKERFFRQGYLSFDSERAVFIHESSSEQHILLPVHVDQVPYFLYAAIRNFFSYLSF